MKNIMMDIETFGLGPFSIGIALGAAWVDLTKQGPEAIKATFYMPIAPDSQPKAGLRMDVDTVCWWMLPAQRPAYDQWLDTPHHEMHDVLFAYAEWLHRLGTVEPFEDEEHWEKEILMWGNGPQFDNARVREWYQAYNLPFPWGDMVNPTGNDRDFRTMKNLPGAKGWAPPHEGPLHNALFDARQQAMWLCNINQNRGLGLT